MSRVIKMSTPRGKPASLPKTAALTKAQAKHKAWLKARGIKVTKKHTSHLTRERSGRTATVY